MVRMSSNLLLSADDDGEAAKAHRISFVLLFFFALSSLSTGGLGLDDA